MKFLKKILITFLVIVPIFSGAVAFDLGDSFGEGFGNLETLADNWVKGVGEDVSTDLFGNTGIGPIPDGEFALPCPEEFNVIGENVSARKFVVRVLNFFLSFLGLLAVAAIIYAGFLYITDGGAGSGQEKAKKIMMYAVIGIIVVLGSFAIVNTIITNAGIGGNDSGDEVAVVSDGIKTAPEFANTTGSTRRCKGDSGFKPLIAKWDKFSGAGFITDFGKGIMVKKGEPVNFSVKMPDNTTPESSEWNFSDGSGFSPDLDEKTNETHTFFDEGWQLVFVQITDTDGFIYRLSKKVFVGNPLEAKFTASNYFPNNGERVYLNASTTNLLVGSITEYVWTSEAVKGQNDWCKLNSENSREISGTFFTKEDDVTTCRITLTVNTNIPEITDTYSEEIEVGALNTTNSNNTCAQNGPIIQIINAEQLRDDDNSFQVKVWADDKVDKPLDDFTFEVWSLGELFSRKTVQFGVPEEVKQSYPNYTVNPVGNALNQNYFRSYSEIILDLSKHKGKSPLIFKAIVRNSLGCENEAFLTEKEYTIGQKNNNEPTGKIISQPILDSFEGKNICENDEFKFTTDAIDPDGDELSYEWEIEGTKFTTKEIDLYKFNKVKDYEVKLNVSDGVATTTLKKTISVCSKKENNPPSVIINKLSPCDAGDTTTIFSFYPDVYDEDGDSLKYEWDFGTGSSMYSKNVAYRFPKAGEYNVKLAVSDGEDTSYGNIDLKIAKYGDPIPECSITVYINNSLSDLTKDKIGIKNKEVLEKELEKLKENLIKKEEKLNDLRNNKNNSEEKKIDISNKIIELTEELNNAKTEVEKEQIREKINTLKEEMRFVDKELFATNTQILETEKEIAEIKFSIESIEQQLLGDYNIRGNVDTNFFLYGGVPIESARAIFIEWDSGDDRKKLGQNVSFRYNKIGTYKVKMEVSDGKNSVFDNIVIKIDSKRPKISNI